MDDINDGEHARETGVIAIPEGSRDDAWVDERGKREDWRRNTIEEETLESLLDGELRVEDDESEGDGKGVIAGVAAEKAANGGDGNVVQVMRWKERL